MSKHLEFYNQSMERGRMSVVGLCEATRRKLISAMTFELITPTEEDLEQLAYENFIVEADKGTFWGCGLKMNGNPRARAYTFTPLRQTLVLFMAAINEEL